MSGISMTPDVKQLVADSAEPVVRLMEGVYDFFVNESGCSPYVKTIYVGFDLNGMMVAAAYPHASSVEVALALPDDAEGEGLIDATHLTWRTMPVAVELTQPSELASVQTYFETAVERVRTGVHDVDLPQERFMARERHIADRQILGRRTG